MSDTIVSLTDSFEAHSFDANDFESGCLAGQGVDKKPYTKSCNYFTTSDLDTLLAMMSDKIFGDRIQLLIGNPGSGKSHFLNNLLDSLSNKVDVRHIHPKHALGEEKLISLLSQTILSKRCTSIGKLKEGLSSVFDNDTRMLILIEDAHNLSPFAINLLIELKYYSVQKSLPLTFVLLARPEIERALESISLNMIDDCIDSHHMPCFSLEQTIAYIKARVIATGYEFNAISANVWKSIHKKSDGWPATINHFVDMHMIQNINSNRIQIWFNDNRSMIGSMLGKSAITVTLLFIAFVFYDAARSTDMKHLKVETSSLNLPTLDVFVKQNIPFAKEQAVKIMSTKLPSVDLPTQPIPTVKKLKIIIKKTVVINKKVALQPDKYNDALSKITAITNGNSWLNQQVEGTYTIQLAASSNKDNINAYINKHALSKKFTAIQLERNQRDWYVVVVGVFDTVSQARAFVALMPSTLTKNNPWIRQISSLQKNLAAIPLPYETTPQGK